MFSHKLNMTCPGPSGAFYNLYIRHCIEKFEVQGDCGKDNEGSINGIKKTDKLIY